MFHGTLLQSVFAVALSFHAFILKHVYFNALSALAPLSASCRNGEGERKGLKKIPIFLWGELYFIHLFPQPGHLSQGTLLKALKERPLGEQSYCRLNLIKGRNAFKCLLFPWAKRLWASPLPPVHPAQTPPPLDAINIERKPGPALPLYHNSVRTKVNALNLISVLVIFNEVAMPAMGGGDVEGGQQVWRDW